MAIRRELKVFINGQFVPERDARISVYDRSFLYGDGVFEGIATFSGRVMFLREHVQRLYASCRYVQITLPVSPDQMEAWIVETARVNELDDQGYIRPLVSRGEGPMGLDQTAAIQKPNIVIIPQLGRSIDYGGQVKCYSAVMSSMRRTPQECLDSRVKANNYLNNVMAQLEASSHRVDVAIMLDTRGFVAEGPGHNIFIVQQKEILTPRPQNVLNGITRQAVLRVAREAGLKVTEADLTLYDLTTADEVFVTNTLSGVAAVTKVGDWIVGDGAPGPETVELRARYVKHALDRGTLIKRT